MELSEDLIKRRSKHFDLSCITLLDLSDAGIERLAHLDKCTNAVEINLRTNQLRRLDGFPSLAALRSLNLSSNKLTSIDDLPPCPALEELSIATNEITMIDFRSLAFKLPQLRSLHLQGNPVALSEDLVTRVKSSLPNLLLLNGEAVALSHATHLISDADAFIAQHTRKIDDMLKQCHDTLGSETARVLNAFNVASVT
ncbi:hypothetical protein Gpo141_00000477 [Globisporangium polare]